MALNKLYIIEQILCHKKYKYPVFKLLVAKLQYSKV